jgi:hypothetical protein
LPTDSLTSPQGDEYMPQVLLVADLGPHNTGAIANDLTPGEQAVFEADITKPEYYVKPTREFKCVDMRIPEGGVQPEVDEAPSQIAGSLPVTETASDLMVAPKQEMHVLKLAEKNTTEEIEAGFGITIHQDEHKGKAGCGAIAKLADRSVLRANAENADIVAPLVWTAASQVLKLDTWLNEDDITALIVNGKNNADNDEIWTGVTPDTLSDAMVAAGANRETLVKDHHEQATLLLAEDKAFARNKFMADHPRADGDYNAAFVATLVSYKNATFELSKNRGETERDAALRVAAGLLFNVGALKALKVPDAEQAKAPKLMVIA